MTIKEDKIIILPYVVQCEEMCVWWTARVDANGRIRRAWCVYNIPLGRWFDFIYLCILWPCELMFTPPSKDDVLWKYDSSATDV